MISDALDDLLTEHFQPPTAPVGLAARAVRAAGEANEEGTRRLARLGVEASTRGVTRIGPGRSTPPGDRSARRHVEQAHGELAEYLAGQRTYFSVAVDLSALPAFQRQVLRAARTIPFGEARPYAWVAARAGSPRAVRAAGTALARNPVPLVVPCHRVLRSDGSLGGYSLIGPRVKRALLGLERRTPLLEGCTGTRVVCRLGCPHLARVRPEHRVVFATVADARSVGYRACRVCHPGRATQTGRR